MSAWHPGAVLLGEYTIEQELGRGGMGRVWLVKGQSTGRRFAVKQALVRDEKHRNAFLTELQTWIDLPEHPNIAPCRFFRTVDDEIVIFTDYIEGGSLADWIAKGKLTSQEQILDIAIQFAWGLHAIHERGLIHQDVKPGNVLMTLDGLPMITDFGLARARLRATDGAFISPALPPDQQSFLVSSRGMTPAYASPEQHNGKLLSRKTDIWSWGVSVLDMFIGGISCPYGGRIAAEVLESFIESEQAEARFPDILGEVGDVLRLCFSDNPTDRWSDLIRASDCLIHCFEAVTGVKYGRTRPNLTTVHEPREMPDDLMDRGRAWLERALRADGRDPEEATAISTRQALSLRGQILDAMAVYDEARLIYERLVKNGRNELEASLALLLAGKASLHRIANDLPGALQNYDCAIKIFERVLPAVGSNKVNLVAGALLNACLDKAMMLNTIGDYSGAIALYDRAIDILKRFSVKPDETNHSNALAVVYSKKANTFRNMGDKRGSLALYDQVIDVYEGSLNQMGLAEMGSLLAKAYTDKACAVCDLGDNQNAVALYDRAILLYERLLQKGWQNELASGVSSTYVNKAISLAAMGDNQGALALYGKAIELYERLVEQEGRSDLAIEMASALRQKANTLDSIHDMPRAVEMYDKAIAIYERLVGREGMHELAGELAGAYLDKAIVTWQMGIPSLSLGLYDKTIATLQRLVENEGRVDLAGRLVRAVLYRAECLDKLGQTEQARLDLQKSIVLLDSEIRRTGRADLKTLAQWAMKNLGHLLR